MTWFIPQRSHTGVTLALLVMACSDGPTSPRVAVTLVDISTPNPAISPGDEVQMDLGVFGRTGRLRDRAVAWSSSNAAAATVSTSGVVTGIAPGITYIKAVAEGVSDSLRFRVVNSFSQVVSGGSFGCGLSPSGPVHCWGYNGGGVVGSVDRDTALPILIPNASFSKLFAESDGNLACGINGQGAASCWGYHQGGFGGSGNVPVAVGNSTPWVSFGATYSLACSLDSNHLAACFGPGMYGQPVPDTIAFASIAVGQTHMCGISTLGQTYCFGQNYSGQLGSTDYYSGPFLVQVRGPAPFTSIVTGATHTCALTTIGQAYCWGSNFNGELGIGRQGSGPSPTPGLVTGGLTWSRIAAGGNLTCGITTSGDTYCWGYLGVPFPNQNYYYSTRPFKITSTLHFDQLSVGGGLGCGHTPGGGAYCWGYGYNGELGNGRHFATLVPQRVIDP